MAPVGPEGHSDTLESPDSGVGIAALETRNGSFARANRAGQLCLCQTEGTASLDHFHPDPEGLALPIVQGPKLWVFELLSEMILKAITFLSVHGSNPLA